jgi:hypothetical protein
MVGYCDRLCFLQCMSPLGVLKWKRILGVSYKNLNNNKEIHEVISRSLHILTNDHIVVSGYGYDIADSSNQEWDLMVIKTDQFGCIDSNDCHDYSKADEPSAITPILEKSFVVYPNPASDLVYILLSNPPSGHTTISIIDANGREVYRSIDVDHLWDIPMDISRLSDGIYTW